LASQTNMGWQDQDCPDRQTDRQTTDRRTNLVADRLTERSRTPR